MKAYLFYIVMIVVANILDAKTRKRHLVMSIIVAIIHALTCIPNF